MPHLKRPAALLALVLLAGCGSTVQSRSTVSVGGGTGLGGPVAADGTQSGPAAAGGAAVASGSTGAVAGAGSAGGVAAGGAPIAGSSAAAGGGSAGAVLPAGPIPAKGRGYDQKYVYIGVVTQNDAQKAFASFGANNVDPGDTNAQAAAVRDEINRRGGIFGRQVKLVFKDVATVSTATNPDSTGSAVCTYFVQDHPVVAVLSIVTLLDYPNFRSCLAKGHTPLFSATVKAADDRDGASLAPYYYQTIAVSWDALAPVLVDRLKAQGWFGGWNARLGQAGSGRAKVGVLVDGTPAGTRIGARLKRELARAGYGDALVYQYTDASQGQSSSVQYFNGNGVTHVIVTDVELTAFQSSAASQQYKPRYGISSYNDPYTNLEASGLTPPGANNGAMGVGWAPTLDTSQANDPGTTPGARECLAVMAKGGQSFSGKRLAQLAAYALCDGMLLTARGAVAGGGLTGTAIGQGIVRIGATYHPANGFAPALTATQHFVPGLARDLAWVPGCSCFRYGSGTARL